MPGRRTPPRLLTIAGSDSGGGAGIQADLKTFAAHGAYGMSAVTAVTAQNTRAVTAVHEVPPDVVAAQIDAVFEDLGVDAVKIGMLSSAPIVRAVAGALGRWCRERPVPVVLDPVMVAKSGASLLADDAVAALVDDLLPLATLVTPNLPEARRMSGVSVEDAEGRLAAARRLIETAGRSGSGAGRHLAVLVKGGHGEGEEVVDLLVPPGGGEPVRFRNRRLETSATHGTGCTLSSAIAARLGRGEGLEQAVAGGIEYLRGAMAAAPRLGSGHGPVDHFHAPLPEDR